MLTGKEVLSFDGETLQLIEETYELDTDNLWAGFNMVEYSIDVYYSKDLEYWYNQDEIKAQEPNLDVFVLYIDEVYYNDRSSGRLEWLSTQEARLKNLFISLKGEGLDLRVKEYQLLALFMDYPGRVFTKQMIYEYIWEEPYYYADNTIMVHISNLRAKLKTIHVNLKNITIRGLEYMLQKETG